MTSKKKIDWNFEAANSPSMDDIIDTELTTEQRDAVEKDLHLVQAAISADRVVVSGDEVFRRLLARCRMTHSAARSIRTLVWANPVAEGERAIDWLRRGAPAEADRKLRSGNVT